MEVSDVESHPSDDIHLDTVSSAPSPEADEMLTQHPEAHPSERLHEEQHCQHDSNLVLKNADGPEITIFETTDVVAPNIHQLVEISLPLQLERHHDQSNQAELKPEQVNTHISEDKQTSLPPYDACLSTRTACIVATSVGATAAIACLVNGAIILIKHPSTAGIAYDKYSLRRAMEWESAGFAINVAITLCTDGMMFVHAVSLRWALYREDRLHYNTNIRLFTSSRSFNPNKWYVNVVALFCLVLTYAASSALFMPGSPEVSSPQLLNGTAVVAMGIGLAGQAVVAAWCLLAPRQHPIPTWSSNPLTTTLAAIHHGRLAHEPGRCMLSVHDMCWRSYQPVHPIERQHSMYRVRPMVPTIIAILWAIAALATAWPVIVTLVCALNNYYDFKGFSWYSGDVSPLILYFSPYDNNKACKEHQLHCATVDWPVATQSVLCILFICLVQSVHTVALHCVELFVNLSRDESTWRSAYKSGGKPATGASLQTNPALAASSSWENLVLFSSKALLHWLIGQAMSSWMLPSLTKEDKGGPSYAFGVVMLYPRLCLYAILVILLAIFTTFLALRKRGGYLPATMGHLPTLANLVDDWRTDNRGRLFWGDKTLTEDENDVVGMVSTTNMVRHAGTSPDRSLVGPIRCRALYAGRGEVRA